MSKEPYSDTILNICKETYDKGNMLFMSAKEIHERLKKTKVDIEYCNMYHILDNLCNHGYLKCEIEKNPNSAHYRRVFRYNP